MRISKRVFQENKARQIYRKTNISYPLIRTRTCAYQGVRNASFSETVACFVFLKGPFWDSPFCLNYPTIKYTHYPDCLIQPIARKKKLPPSSHLLKYSHHNPLSANPKKWLNVKLFEYAWPFWGTGVLRFKTVQKML